MCNVTHALLILYTWLATCNARRVEAVSAWSVPKVTMRQSLREEDKMRNSDNRHSTLELR